MKKKTILKIERDLKRRAKKMRLGKKRSGAYVYGTMRKIRGNGFSSESYRRTGHDDDRYDAEDLKPMRTENGFMLIITRPDGSTQFSPSFAAPYPTRARAESAKKYFLRQDREMAVMTGKSFIKSIEVVPAKSLMKNPGKIHPRIRETLKRYGFFSDDEGRKITDKDALQFLKRLYRKIPKNQRTLDGVENAIVRYMGAKERQAYRALGKNPVNDVLEILTQDQILAEYKKGGEGQQAKLMFTSKPMSGMSASQLVRRIGNYNNFSWRRVSPFLGKLHFMNQSLTLPMTFRVGREYSPAIYIENVDMPRYANRLIEYAKKNLKADEATYTPVARRVRLWWD